MKGNKDIIDYLNQVLTNELSAINQYFLHARMLQDWGFAKVGKLEYEASIDEMRHADEIIKRILFLEGLPNVQRLKKVNIGQNVEEIFECDLKVEMEAQSLLREAITACEKHQDYITRTLFAKILDSEEEHIDWLETQLSVYKKIGEQNYLQSQLAE